MSTPTSIEQILSHDLTSFVRDGRLFRVMSENDDDCIRDTVEEYVNARWKSVVIASPNWRAEFERFVAPVARAA